LPALKLRKEVCKTAENHSSKTNEMACVLTLVSCRVLAAPASLVMAVAQGACLGQQDAWTPFKVLLAVVLLSAGKAGVLSTAVGHASFLPGGQCIRQLSDRHMCIWQLYNSL
jgi:hypothetical protein